MKKIPFSFILILGLLGALLFTTGAFAGGTSTNIISSSGGSGGDMQKVLCNALSFITGSVGKTLAAFIIIGMGIGFFTAKVSWGVLIGVTLGIASMFGAPAIVAAVTGGSTTFCADYTA